MLRHVLPWLGLVLLLPPTYLTARWIYVFNAVRGYDARLAAFTSGFPHWLQDPMTWSRCCARRPGTTVGLVGLVVVTGRRRVICGAAVTFGLVLAWWLAWTLL